MLCCLSTHISFAWLQAVPICLSSHQSAPRYKSPECCVWHIFCPVCEVSQVRVTVRKWELSNLWDALCDSVCLCVFVFVCVCFLQCQDSVNTSTKYNLVTHHYLKYFTTKHLSWKDIEVKKFLQQIQRNKQATSLLEIIWGLTSIIIYFLGLIQKHFSAAIKKLIKSSVGIDFTSTMSSPF